VELVECAGGYRSADAPGLLLLYANGGEQIRVREGKGRASLHELEPGSSYKDIGWIALEREGRAGADNRFAVLLYPFEETSPPVQFRPVSAADYTGEGAYVIVEHGEWRDHLVFSDGKMRSFGTGALTTDGIFTFLRCRDDEPLHMALVQGARLVFQGKTLSEGEITCD
jgi:hypothetical protein